MPDESLLTGGRILYAGVGNTLRSDDGAGCYIAAGIKERDNIHVCIACENTEMIYHDALSFMPERVVIFDACLMGMPAGSFRMLNPSELADGSMSTHKMPLNMICRLITEDTEADIVIAAIQPKSTEPESDMTPAVKQAAEDILRIINSTATRGAEPQ